MYKATIEIGSINKFMKLKFSLIIKSDPVVNYSHNIELASKYFVDGNNYLKINPKPFITIDISGRKANSTMWSSCDYVTLGRKPLFGFYVRLNRMLRSFSTVKNLFYYDNKILKVDKILANDLSFNFSLPNHKVIHMEPSVVPGETENDYEYEGCLFYINSYDNYCYLSYEDASYLCYEINKIDMTQLSLSLMRIAHDLEKQDAIHLEAGTISKEINVAGLDNNPVKIEKVNEIPNI